MTRLRTLLNTIFLALALIPLLVLGAILGLTLYKSQIDSAYHSAKALSTSVGIKAEDILGRIVTDVRSITRYKDFSFPSLQGCKGLAHGAARVSPFGAGNHLRRAGRSPEGQGIGLQGLPAG